MMQNIEFIGDHNMPAHSLPKLKIGNLEVDVPIIQGGMGVGISMAGLASAVANAGGIGVISSVGLGLFDPDFNKLSYKEANKKALREEIQKAKKMTNGAIGVNVMLALTDCNEHIEIAVEEKADVVIMGAGLPLRHPTVFSKEASKNIITKFIPKVSSARAVKLIFQFWARNYQHIPDAVIVEGPLAGGHLGFTKEQINDPAYALEKLVPEVISVVKPFAKQFNKNVPVIAAGGIYTGGDIYKFLQLGAQGVGMGTRFVATKECDVADEFKQLYVDCKKEDITIIDSPVGLPGRVIQTKFIEGVKAGMKMPFECIWKCLKTCDFLKTPYCIATALHNAKLGNLNEGFAFAGANAYRVNKIITVQELIQTLIKEYKEAANKR